MNRHLHRNARSLSIVCLLAFTFVLDGCAYNVHDLATFEAESVHSDSPKYSGIPLKNGQIVVTEKGSAAGMLISLFAVEYAEFGHSGIVAIENDRAYVYEALATIRPHLSGPVTNAMSGRVKRTRLDTFLSRHRIIAAYDPPASVDQELFTDFARQQYRDKRAFDPYFDARDTASVYCNEFVAEALEFAGRAPVRTTATTDNPSIQLFMRWLKIDTDRFILAKDLLEGATRSVLISRSLSPPQIAAHIELRRELHRRFTNNQRPGNLFSWSSGGPRFRPTVYKYLRDGIERAAAETEISIPQFVDHWTAQNLHNVTTNTKMARHGALAVAE